jgi:transcriptional regulator with XRE-family HTH domain
LQVAQKENFKTAGLRLREHRAALGLDRDQLGARIGVSGSTIKQVELGYQALGRAASERLAQLLAPPRLGYIGEEPAHYGAGHSASDAVSAALALACEERIKSAAEGVASALGCHYREALEIVIRRELGKDQK